MLNKDAKLSAKLFADDIEKASTRDGFGTGSVEAGRSDSRVVVLCADLKESTRAEWFQKEFPDRFIGVWQGFGRFCGQVPRRKSRPQGSAQGRRRSHAFPPCPAGWPKRR